MTSSDNEEKIKEIIAGMLNIEPTAIKLESNIREDLKADDTDMIEIVGVIGEDFNIELSDDEVVDAVTVGDLVTLVESKSRNSDVTDKE